MMFHIRSLFISDSKFSMKIALLKNNNPIPPHPRAKILDHIWKLKLIPNYLHGNSFEENSHKEKP